MKTLILLCLALLSAPAVACDWQVSKQVDPMDDAAECTVYSPSAKIAFYRHGDDRPNVKINSAYSMAAPTIRIDDNEAVYMGDNAYTRQKALDVLLPQLRAGERIRVRFDDYPDPVSGDAPVCNLPELLANCTQ